MSEPLPMAPDEIDEALAEGLRTGQLALTEAGKYVLGPNADPPKGHA